MYGNNPVNRENMGQRSGRCFGRCGRRAATEDMVQEGVGMRRGQCYGAGRGRSKDCGVVMDGCQPECEILGAGRGRNQNGQGYGRGQSGERGQSCRQGHGQGMCRRRNMGHAPARPIDDDAAN